MRVLTFVCAAVAAVMCAVACGKMVEDVRGDGSVAGQESETVEMRLSVVGDGGAVVRTKSSAADFDQTHSVVSSVQFFVFDGKVLDVYKKITSGTEATLTVRAGEKTVWAVVNAPDISDVTTLTQLKAVQTTLLDNAARFVMVGSSPATVPSEDPVEIEVKRIASRVVLKKITAAFTSPAYAAMNCILDRIFLVNVPGDTNLGLTAAPTAWFSKQDYEHNDYLMDHLSSPGLGEDLNAAPYVKVTRHYSYPNPTVDDSHATDWSPRHTRLVVKVYLGGEVFYYPITLPVLEPGKSYEIENLTITRKGSTSPDLPIPLTDASFELSVKDWTVVPVVEGTTL